MYNSTMKHISYSCIQYVLETNLLDHRDRRFEKLTTPTDISLYSILQFTLFIIFIFFRFAVCQII